MVELVGCLPSLHVHVSKDLGWIKGQICSTKEEIREYSVLLYALILNSLAQDSEFESAVKPFISQINSKNLEAQHGALLAIGTCLETKIMSQKIQNKMFENWSLVKTSINAVGMSNCFSVILRT